MCLWNRIAVQAISLGCRTPGPGLFCRPSMRAADSFPNPLLGAHSGRRLGERVEMGLFVAVVQIDAVRVCIDVVVEKVDPPPDVRDVCGVGRDVRCVFRDVAGIGIHRSGRG